MRYKQLKKADVQVSEIAVGTWSLGEANYGSVKRSDAEDAIRAAIKEGVNLIDTAPCYGNGASEMIVGEALSDIARSEYLLSTKCTMVPDVHCKGYKRDGSYQNIMREVKSSLMNLRTDYIDFYFLHYPDPNTPIEESMDAMNRLKKEGVIRFIGVSNFTKEQVEQAMQYGKIDVQQPPFSMVDQRYTQLMEWGYEQGIDNFTYGSLGAGVLSGAYRSKPDFPPNDFRWTFYDFFREPKFSKIQELLKLMDRIGEDHGNRALSEIAINWSTQKEFVGTALVGAGKVKHVQQNCAAFDWMLTKDEIEELDHEILRLGIS